MSPTTAKEGRPVPPAGPIPLVRTLGHRARGDRPVVLVAQAAHHLEELVPLRTELERRAVPVEIVSPVPPRKLLNRFRPGVRRHRQLLRTGAAPDEPAPGAPVPGEPLVLGAGAIVVMNDWGVTAPLVALARSASVPTFAWVEGVQDFADDDTGRRRRPYTNVDHVFCLGPYDHDQLASVDRTIVGSTRLRRLWEAPAIDPDESFVTVNSNFTYGVLTEHRRAWLRSAVDACRAAGIRWTISRHVAERGVVRPWWVSHRSADELLDRSTVLVSRFSTLGYEALVRGVGLAYHNPHDEQVPTFREPLGAFTSTTSTAALTDVLRTAPVARERQRALAREFLARHLRLGPGLWPAELTADLITERRA